MYSFFNLFSICNKWAYYNFFSDISREGKQKNLHNIYKIFKKNAIIIEMINGFVATLNKVYICISFLSGNYSLFMIFRIKESDLSTVVLFFLYNSSINLSLLTSDCWNCLINNSWYSN